MDVGDIWPVTMADADWVIAMAEERYGQKLDREGCRAWIADAITLNRDTFFCRSDTSVGVAVAQRAFYDPAKVQVHMIYLMAKKNRKLAGYRMLLTMALWAKSIGATSFHFGSSTTYDLSAFARRMAAVGAKLDRPTWTLTF